MIYRIKKIKIEAWNVSFIDKMKRIIDYYFPCREAEETDFKKFIEELGPWNITRRNKLLIITVHSEASEICKITIEKLED